MYQDTELQRVKRKAWFQSGLVILLILLVFFGIVNAIGLVAGNAFYKEFCQWHTRFGLHRFEPLKAILDEGLKTKGWQNVSIESRLGYTLQGTYLPNHRPTNNTIVFVHGIAANRLMGLWYAPLYWSAGYNVLVYDSRACGESGGNSLTWGFYERYDLDQWIDWVMEHNPGGVIGVHGMSMGAATALMHAELNETSHKVKFYIADSAYSDLEELLTQQIAGAVRLNNPNWVRLLLWYADIAANWQSGFRFQDVSPVRSVQKVTTPILYLHGENDVVVPAAMCDQLYAASKGYKEIKIFPKESHAMAYFKQQAGYRQQILGFINHRPVR